MPEHEQQDEFSFKNYFVPFTTIKAIHWIVIIGLVVFFNGLFNNFVGDDEGQIVTNVLAHSLTNIFVFFNGSTFFNGSSQLPYGSYYKPLLLTSYSGIYTFFGPNYFMFHLVQLLFHLMNTILLFLVLKHFLKKQIAFVLSLIFLTHPINSEAVFYISDMQDVLFFFFGIVSLWIVQNYYSQRSLIITSICLLLSLFSKETGLLFFFIIPLYLFLFKRRGLLFVLGAEVLVFVVYLLLRIHAIGIFSQLSASSVIANSPLSSRLLNIPAMFLFYLKTFIYPKNLAMSYQWVYTQMNFSDFWLPLLIDLLFLAFILLIAYSIHIKSSRKFFAVYLFFVFWFVIGMVFHMQLIPLDATVADRWFYFPFAGLLGMIGITIEAFRVNLKNKWIVAIIVVILLMLSIRTFVRSFDWRDEITLGTHDIKISDAWGTEVMLSAAYGRERDFKDAKIHAERSVELYPQMSNYMNLGIIDANLGEYKQAKSAYQTSLQLGEYYQTYESLAYLDTVYGNPQQNIDYIKNVALKKFPQDAILWFCLAILEYNQGDKNTAQTDIAQAYTYSPTSQIASVYNAIMQDKLKKITVHF